MTNTENLDLPYIDAAQAQKHVTHNEALRALDVLVQLSVVSRIVVDAPQDAIPGARYIVPSGAIGAWAGNDGSIASFADSVWSFYAPESGWRAYIQDEDRLVVWNGSMWSPLGGGGGTGTDTSSIERLGINAPADTLNRLTVQSEGVLFNYDATAVSGDIRVVFNKEGLGDTASAIFQNGFSGRAEIGLAGDDNLAVKVSPDGQNWKNSLRIDGMTSGVSVPFLDSQQVIVGFEEVATVVTPSAGGIVFISVVNPSFPQNRTASLFAYDVGTSPLLTTMFLGASVENHGTSTLTGTTGQVGKIGVSVNASGELKVENRYIGNTDRQICLTFINSYRQL